MKNLAKNLVNTIYLLIGLMVIGAGTLIYTSNLNLIVSIYVLTSLFLSSTIMFSFTVIINLLVSIKYPENKQEKSVEQVENEQEKKETSKLEEKIKTIKPGEYLVRQISNGRLTTMTKKDYEEITKPENFEIVAIG